MQLSFCPFAVCASHNTLVCGLLVCGDIGLGPGSTPMTDAARPSTALVMQVAGLQSGLSTAASACPVTRATAASASTTTPSAPALALRPATSPPGGARVAPRSRPRRSTRATGTGTPRGWRICARTARTASIGTTGASPIKPPHRWGGLLPWRPAGAAPSSHHPADAVPPPPAQHPGGAEGQLRLHVLVRRHRGQAY